MPSSRITPRYSARQRRMLLAEEIEDSMRSTRMVGEALIFLFIAGCIGLAIFLYLR
jgi:hypothetical protein